MSRIPIGRRPFCPPNPLPPHFSKSVLARVEELLAQASQQFLAVVPLAIALPPTVMYSYHRVFRPRYKSLSLLYPVSDTETHESFNSTWNNFIMTILLFFLIDQITCASSCSKITTLCQTMGISTTDILYFSSYTQQPANSSLSIFLKRIFYKIFEFFIWIRVNFKFPHEFPGEKFAQKVIKSSNIHDLLKGSF